MAQAVARPPGTARRHAETRSGGSRRGGSRRGGARHLPYPLIAPAGLLMPGFVAYPVLCAAGPDNFTTLTTGFSPGAVRG